MEYLLDTNAISHAARFPGGPVAQRMRVNKFAVCTSVMVKAEIQFGLAPNPASRVGREALQVILASLNVLVFDAPAAEHYGDIRAVLESAGYQIGAMDTLIAAHARSLGLTVVTGNVGHFVRVPQLAVENWEEPVSGLGRR